MLKFNLKRTTSMDFIDLFEEDTKRQQFNKRHGRYAVFDSDYDRKVRAIGLRKAKDEIFLREHLDPSAFKREKALLQHTLKGHTNSLANVIADTEPFG